MIRGGKQPAFARTGPVVQYTCACEHRGVKRKPSLNAHRGGRKDLRLQLRSSKCIRPCVCARRLELSRPLDDPADAMNQASNSRIPSVRPSVRAWSHSWSHLRVARSGRRVAATKQLRHLVSANFGHFGRGGARGTWRSRLAKEARLSAPRIFCLSSEVSEATWLADRQRGRRVHR
eukprot:1184881-Prorocentrum_minimum.AAC.2